LKQDYRSFPNNTSKFSKLRFLAPLGMAGFRNILFEIGSVPVARTTRESEIFRLWVACHTQTRLPRNAIALSPKSKNIPNGSFADSNKSAETASPHGF
jgi:hypothetical protein